MRIAIVGAGAMGSIFGSAFARAGLDTWLVDANRQLVERLRSKGLVVVRDGNEQLTRPHATADPTEVGPVDLAFFLVKCYSTATAAQSSRPLVGPDTVVVSLQNGWGNGEVLAASFDRSHLVLGVTYNGGTVLELGRVAHTGSGPTFIGPYPGASASMTDVALSAMRAAAIDVTARTDIETVIWQKLILNAATLPTSALTGLRMGPLGEPPLIGLLDAIAREAVAVARAAGHPIDLEERLETIHRIVAGASAGKASMLQDVEAGRRTEIDVITGAVIRMAEQFGVDVPINRALFALVKGVERARELN